MLLRVRHLNSLLETGSEMGRLSRQYASDMEPFSSWAPWEIQTYIKNIPYRADPVGMEYLSRPHYTILGHMPFDCDDRCICIGAWAVLNSCPYLFIAARQDGRKTYHHVYPRVYIDEEWKNLDCTYPWHIYNEPKNYASELVIYEGKTR